MAEVTFLQQRVGKLGVPDDAMDRAAMYEVARQFFAARESETPEGLFDLDDVMVENRREQRPRFEVRHRQIRRPELSVIGAKPPMTPAPWAELLELLYNERVTGLETEQPAADWKLVGVLIRQVDQSKVLIHRGDANLGGGTDPANAVTKTGGRWDDRNLAGMTMKVTPANKIVDDRQVAMLVDLVFADMTQAESLSHPGDRHSDYIMGSSPMERYANGRLLKYMPKAFRDERKQAQLVMEEIARARTASTPVDKLAALTVEELQGMVQALGVERVADLLGVDLEALRSKLATAEPEPVSTKAKR